MSIETLLKSWSDGLMVTLQLRDHDVVMAAYAASFKWRVSQRQPGASELLVVAKLFANEAVRRAEMVDAKLRQSRPSWPQREIVENENRVRQAARDVLTSTLGPMGNAVDDAAGIIAMRQSMTFGNSPLHNAMGEYDAYITKSARGSVQIVDAAIADIVSAARADLERQEMSKGTTYNNTYNGPVGGVAQGGGSIGSVSQRNEGPSVEELADAVSKLLASVESYSGNDQNVIAAISDLKTSLAALEEKRVPFASLTRAVQFFAGAGELVSHVPAAIDGLEKLKHLLLP